jgi:hypothetical protein
MGSRRLGRKRLYSLEKRGQENPNRPGAGIEDAVVYSKVSRDGAQILTEIVVDLGTSKAAIQSKDTDADVIGVSAGGAAHLGLLTVAANGIITDIEMICTEAPVTGELDIDLVRLNDATKAFDEGAGSNKLIDTGADWVKGLTKTGTVDDASASDDAQYLYLAVGTSSSPSAGTYSAGKYVIRLIGYAVEADI